MVVQIVPWRITGVEAGPVWDAIAGYHYDTTGAGDAPLPDFHPTRSSSILADSDDATWVEVHPDPSGTHASLYGQLTPTKAIPSGEPLWVRTTVRWSATAIPARWAGIFTTYPTPDGSPDRGNLNAWVNIIEFGTRETTAPSVGVVEEVFLMERGTLPDYAEIDEDPRLVGYAVSGYMEPVEPGFEGPFDQFRQGFPKPVWVEVIKTNATGYIADERARFHDILVEVAYPGTRELPLRQRQRQDHLAPGGAARARVGTASRARGGLVGYW